MMSSPDKVQFKMGTMFLDDSEQSNVELQLMKENKCSHNHRTLEELIDQSDSSIINLAHQQLTDDDLSTIIDFAMKKKKCTELKLGYNYLTCNGMKKLADGLDDNTSLVRLNLFNNKIADQGVYYLCLNNCKLRTLYLGQNQITDKGAEYLSEMLKTNTTLTQLGLSNNEITDLGVIHIANSLTHENTTLKELYLWGNKLIDQTCIDALVDMLVYNRTLNKLVLFDCNLSDSSKDRLQEVVKSRPDFALFL